MSQIIGPAVPLRGADSGNGAGNARPHMRQLNGVERGQGLGVILEVQRDLPDEFVYFQVPLPDARAPSSAEPPLPLQCRP